jgi:hypothetical protein
MAYKLEDIHTILAASGRSPEIPSRRMFMDGLLGAGSWMCSIMRRLTLPRCVSRPRRISDGYWKAARCRMSGSCRGVRSVRQSSKKTNNMYGMTLGIWDPFDSGLADKLDQSGNGPSRGTNPPLERQRYRPGGCPAQRRRDPLDLHGDHTRFIPVDWRIAAAGRQDLGPRRQVSRQANESRLSVKSRPSATRGFSYQFVGTDHKQAKEISAPSADDVLPYRPFLNPGDQRRLARRPPYAPVRGGVE